MQELHWHQLRQQGGQSPSFSQMGSSNMFEEVKRKHIHFCLGKLKGQFKFKMLNCFKVMAPLRTRAQTYVRSTLSRKMFFFPLPKSKQWNFHRLREKKDFEECHVFCNPFHERCSIRIKNWHSLPFKMLNCFKVIGPLDDKSTNLYQKSVSWKMSFSLQNQSTENFIDKGKRKFVKNVVLFAIHFMKEVAKE